jgi:hypothetical protein
MICGGRLRPLTDAYVQTAGRPEKGGTEGTAAVTEDMK